MTTTTKPSGRIQLALNVADLAAAIRVYSDMFGTGPSKERPGYANFAIADPPLKLVLFTGMGEPGSLNHIGVEVEDVEAVQAMIAHVNDLGLDQQVREDTSCCFAVQDKTWVKGPENDWEFYFVKGDAPTMSYADDDEASRWSDDRAPELETVPAAKSTCC